MLNYLPETLFRLSGSHFSEKTAVSKLTISQETCHMLFWNANLRREERAEGE